MYFEDSNLSYAYLKLKSGKQYSYLQNWCQSFCSGLHRYIGGHGRLDTDICSYANTYPVVKENNIRVTQN